MNLPDNLSDIFTDSFSLLLLIVLVAICVHFLGRKIWKNNSGFSNNLKNPPSLPWLPLVGSLPFLPEYSEFHTFFTKKAEKLGPVIGFYMGSQYTVMVTGIEAINDALTKKHDMATRPKFFSMEEFFNPGYKGIIDHMYDEEYKTNRKMILYTLGEFGFGKRILERRIRHEIDNVIKALRENSGKNFDPCEIIAAGDANIILSILFNKRFEYNDPDFLRMMELNGFFIQEFYDFMAVDAFKELLYFPKYRKILSANIRHRSEFMNWINKAILEAQSRPEQAENFVSFFIEKLGKETYNYENLAITVRDLLVGGSDTSIAFINFFIIYMANYPNVQARIQEELDRVIGNDREVTLEDQKSLPYTQATILELLRHQTLTPLALPHSALQDTTILDYFVPANATIIVNLYGAHMDPKLWPNPKEFKPERFLDENGLVFGKKRIVPFGMGKRSCIGEQQARLVIFLFCSSLVHHFNILPPEGQDKICMKLKTSVITSPENYQVRLVPRNRDKGYSIGQEDRV